MAPQLSVVIPTRSRPQALNRCLDALAASEGPLPDWEVIVVDDGSPNPVAPARSLPMPVHVLRQAHSGPATARNRGAALARGRTLVFLDDDCQPEPAWLLEISRCAQKNPGACVGGRVRNRLEHSSLSRHGQLLLDYLYQRLNPDPGRCRFLASSNLAVAAAEFRDLGGFCQSFPLAAAEDRDFCRRWLERGGRLVYAAQAVVWHAHAYTLLSFLRQHYHYGRGAYRFHRASARGPEPAGFYLGLLRAGLGARLALPMLVSQLAHTAGYLREGWSRPRPAR